MIFMLRPFILSDTLSQLARRNRPIILFFAGKREPAAGPVQY